MEAAYFGFALFIFALLCVLLLIARQLYKSAKKPDQFEREVNWAKRYQELQNMVDGFEAYVDEVQDELRQEKAELRRMQRHMENTYRKMTGGEDIDAPVIVTLGGNKGVTDYARTMRRPRPGDFPDIDLPPEHLQPPSQMVMEEVGYPAEEMAPEEAYYPEDYYEEPYYAQAPAYRDEPAPIEPDEPYEEVPYAAEPAFIANPGEPGARQLAFEEVREPVEAFPPEEPLYASEPPPEERPREQRTASALAEEDDIQVAPVTSFQRHTEKSRKRRESFPSIADEVVWMHKMGFSVINIAQQLSITRSEVALIIEIWEKG